MHQLSKPFNRLFRGVSFVIALLLSSGCSDSQEDASFLPDGDGDLAAASETSDAEAGEGAEIEDGEFGESERQEAKYPHDEALRLNHIQMKGSHNSTHIAPEENPGSYAYTMAPIEEQLSHQGVRQFEIDVHDNPAGGLFVFHEDNDPLSLCDDFVGCLQRFAQWSNEHPEHHALFLFVEPKDPDDDPEFNRAIHEKIETAILSVFDKEKLITPDDVRGDFATLKEAVTTQGWPSLGETRGKILFVMLDSLGHRETYLKDAPSLEGRLMFVTSATDQDCAAVLMLDNPLWIDDYIRESIAEGYIVRTRADVCCEEADANDRTRAEAALASGAQIISTDFPAKVEGRDYFFEIADGTPSRCNPILAPDFCRSEDIEALDFTAD